MSYYDKDTYGLGGVQTLIGTKIKRIFMNEERLGFVTDKGKFVFYVDGDCCSSSYFHDFIEVKRLLRNKLVKAVERIDLDSFEDDYEYVQCYGYRIVTEDKKFGEVSSVFSFRNKSNGYYGGEIHRSEREEPWFATGDELTKDKIG